MGNEGIVLLKNDKNVQPLPADARNILVVGENAIKMMTVGGGSSSLKVQREILPLDGIRQRFGAENVRFVRGYVGDVSGEYNGVVTGQDLRDDRSAAVLREEAVTAAREADYVIYIGGLNKSAGQDCEDSDRKGLELPYDQDALIRVLAKANPRTIVLNISGNPVAMPWKDDVAAILQVWMLGSEAGHSIADVLSGDVNPSGKLPFTSYATLDQCGAHALGTYPGVKRADADLWDVEYKEDIFVGYRWVDKHRLAPNFPFGHGLSYTTFAYGKLEGLPRKAAIPSTEQPLQFSLTLTNTGQRDGSEVVQVYVRDSKCSVPRPVRELKAFQKVQLRAGQTQTITFALDEKAFHFYDDKTQRWVVEPGEFEVEVGSSSRDLRSKAKIMLY